MIVGWIVLCTLFDIGREIKKHFENADEFEFESEDVLKAKAQVAGSDVLTKRKKGPERISKLTQFLANCSLYSNTLNFFRTDNGGKITCLNGLRVFSMVWIVWGHTYKYLTDRDEFFQIG